VESDAHALAGFDLGRVAQEARGGLVPDEGVAAAEHGQGRQAVERRDETRERGPALAGAHARRLGERLEAFRLDRQLAARRERLERQHDRLAVLFRADAERRRARLGQLLASLDGLSPLSVLGRGYALVWDETAGRLVRDASEVEVGAGLRIRLHRGALSARIVSKETE